MHYGKKASRQRKCDGLGSVLQGNLGYHLSKHCCRPFMESKAKMIWGAQQKVRGVYLTSKFPRSHSTQTSVGNKSDPWRLYLATYRTCQIPQHTFTGLVESMPRQVRAVLEPKGGPTQYRIKKKNHCDQFGSAPTDYTIWSLRWQIWIYNLNRTTAKKKKKKSRGVLLPLN